jgi:phosphoadenosine phosphosulfate reductase
MSLELSILSHLVEGLDPVQSLRAISNLGVKVKFSSSLGEEDQVITEMIATNKLDIPIFTLDTGRLFYESYDLLQLTTSKYNVKIETYHPDPSELQEYSKHHGMNGFYKSVELRQRCCEIRKINPLKLALQNTDIWITGLRAKQSSNRSSLTKIAWDETFQVFKFNPLLHWGVDELREYIDHHHVPINPLHTKGFTSIGCAPCTRAVSVGEDPRAGRWWWEQSKKECGLHQH